MDIKPFLFFSFLILLSCCCWSSAKAVHTNLQRFSIGRKAAPIAAVVVGDHEDEELRLARRELSRLGSSPPRCASMCGKCRPCTAVFVAVPLGTEVKGADYYPEVWRCKCGNELYMPGSSKIA